VRRHVTNAPMYQQHTNVSAQSHCLKPSEVRASRYRNNATALDRLTSRSALTGYTVNGGHFQSSDEPYNKHKQRISLRKRQLDAKNSRGRANHVGIRGRLGLAKPSTTSNVTRQRCFVQTGLLCRIRSFVFICWINRNYVIPCVYSSPFP